MGVKMEAKDLKLMYFTCGAFNGSIVIEAKENILT